MTPEETVRTKLAESVARRGHLQERLQGINAELQRLTVERQKLTTELVACEGGIYALQTVIGELSEDEDASR